MRRVLRAVALLVGVLAAAVGCQQLRLTEGDALPPRDPALLRVATHNVHYIVLGQAEGRWSVGDWERRKPALDAAFKALDADLVAFQEMESFAGGSEGSVNLARDWLLARNPGYAAAASGDSRTFPSTQPILYRTDRLALRDQGWFFFSDTPDVIYSRTFNGSWPAFASWAEFATPEGRVFRVVNVHFEYRSASNRRLSAALVVERIRPVIEAGTPVILMGDTNALQGWRTMDILRGAGITFLPLRAATYHLDRGINLLPAIDHIGIGPGLSVARGPVALQRRFADAFPSDHYPVTADLILR